jgi:hypothetical protein
MRVPGPSFLRPSGLRLHAAPGDPGRAIELGMGRPSTTDDGWWLSHVWASDADEVVEMLDVAPPAGPPAAPPQAILGPVFAGALAGLIAEENGRQLVRLKLHPARHPERAWERPLIVQVAIKWDAVRAATMPANELARTVLEAFGRAVMAAGRPG